MTSDAAFARVVRCAAALPGAQVSTWYGTPALKVGGKGFCRMKEGMDDVLVVLVPPELKDALLAAEPALYFETPHYAGWPAMLVRLDAIGDDDLKTRLACAWAEKAPARLKKEFAS